MEFEGSAAGSGTGESPWVAVRAVAGVVFAMSIVAVFSIQQQPSQHLPAVVADHPGPTGRGGLAGREPLVTVDCQPACAGHHGGQAVVPLVIYLVDSHAEAEDLTLDFYAQPVPSIAGNFPLLRAFVLVAGADAAGEALLQAMIHDTNIVADMPGRLHIVDLRRHD